MTEKIRNIGGHFRCSICNKVSMEEIATEIGDFTSNNFTHDPKDKSQFICIDCHDAIEDVRYDYHLMDNPEELY